MKILAPAIPLSSKCPSWTRSMPPSLSPTTGVEFSSWNSWIRRSRLSPMWVEVGSESM